MFKKKKNSKLKIFISLLFQGKKIMKFDFKKKKYSEQVRNQ